VGSPRRTIVVGIFAGAGRGTETRPCRAEIRPWAGQAGACARGAPWGHCGGREGSHFEPDSLLGADQRSPRFRGASNTGPVQASSSNGGPGARRGDGRARARPPDLRPLMGPALRVLNLPNRTELTVRPPGRPRPGPGPLPAPRNRWGFGVPHYFEKPRFGWIGFDLLE
jgi:hypothetical protein